MDPAIMLGKVISSAKALGTKFTVTGAQKAHIDRLVFELTQSAKEIATLIQRLEDAESENTNLKATITKLQTQLDDANAKIAELEKPQERLNKDQEKILFFMADEQPHSARELIQVTGLLPDELNRMLDKLCRDKFIRLAQAATPRAIAARRGSGSPRLYRIDDLGIQYARKYGSEQGEDTNRLHRP